MRLTIYALANMYAKSYIIFDVFMPILELAEPFVLT